MIVKSEGYVNLLKEDLKQYGNMTLQELIKKIEDEEKEIKDIENVKLKWTKYYGRGANELAGERYYNKGTFKELIGQIFHNNVSLLSLSDLDDEYIEDVLIQKKLANELYVAIYESEQLGNSWKVEYELEFIDEKPNKDMLKKYLSRLKNKDGWDYEELKDYFIF